VPVVVLGLASLVVSLVVATTGSWSVLVAVGAALEAMIYAVAAFCVVRLRTRLPAEPRPFRLPAARLLGIAGIAVFAVLAAVASVSVANHLDLVPLVVLAATGGASALYVLVVLPRVRAAHEARRTARGRRRPPPRPPGAAPTGRPPGDAAAR
jgi:amino acid transporter